MFSLHWTTLTKSVACVFHIPNLVFTLCTLWASSPTKKFIKTIDAINGCKFRYPPNFVAPLIPTYTKLYKTVPVSSSDFPVWEFVCEPSNETWELFSFSSSATNELSLISLGTGCEYSSFLVSTQSLRDLSELSITTQRPL